MKAVVVTMQRVEYDYTEDPTDVARSVRLRDIALAHAVPLEKFRALINME